MSTDLIMNGCWSLSDALPVASQISTDLLYHLAFGIENKCTSAAVAKVSLHFRIDPMTLAGVECQRPHSGPVWQPLGLLLFSLVVVVVFGGVIDVTAKSASALFKQSSPTKRRHVIAIHSSIQLQYMYPGLPPPPVRYRYTVR